MDKAAPAEAPKAQPKISQKMLIRFAVGLFILAGLYFGFQKWRDYSQDPDLPTENETAGMIAAVMEKEDGAQAVVLQEDGSILESPGWQEGKEDRDPVWRPDGNRLFFVSDREEEAFHIYRWNFASNQVKRRSYGSRSQSTPTFPLPDAPGANETALLTAGGFVLEFDPKKTEMRQVLPPVAKEVAKGEEEGAASQFDAVYQKLGQGFRSAKWGKDKEWIYAVMRREDDSEILIAQSLKEAMAPVPVVAGDQIEFDVNPESGAVVFACNGFRFHDPAQIPPEMIKNGKVTLPFTSIVGMFDPKEKRLDRITYTNDVKVGFHEPDVSPDGTLLIFMAGKRDVNGNFVPENLVSAPAAPEGGTQARLIMKGQIYEPSWHPNSHTIAFIQRDSGGKRGIFTINKDGSALTDVSKGKGNFSHPVFSPQTK